MQKEVSSNRASKTAFLFLAILCEKHRTVTMRTRQKFITGLKRWRTGIGLARLFLSQAGFSQVPPITVVTAEEPPTNFSENGRLTGMVTEVVEAILAATHMKTDIKVYPWARAYDMATRQANVIIFTAGKTQDRIDHGFTFLGPVTTRRHILYKKAGRTLAINRIEDIKRQQLRVGAMLGDWRGSFFKNQGIVVEEVPSHAQNIKKAVSGRIDLFVLSDLELGENLKIAEVSPNQIEEAYTFQERDAYILLSKGTAPQTISQWQEAFSALQASDFFARTAKKWSGHLGLPLRYSNSKGFYIKK